MKGNKKLNNLLTSVFLMGVGIALLQYLGVTDWFAGLNTGYQVLMAIVGTIIVTLLIVRRKK